MSQRILVIDPSRVMRQIFEVHLSQVGHQVLTAEGSQEGVALLQALAFTPPDLLFVRLQRPERDDYRVISYVQASPWLRHLMLIAVVAQEDLAAVQHALPQVPLRYLVKPFRVQELLALVASLEGRRPTEGSVAATTRVSTGRSPFR